MAVKTDEEDKDKAKAAVRLFHAGLPDTDQMEIVDDFGKQDAPVRLLLATDVASEGVNLHFYCNHLVHFDIPWSLITLEQRNGRIDRYGQEHIPHIVYLVTTSKADEARDDLRIMDRLIEKEDAAHKNIGDAATILRPVRRQARRGPHRGRVVGGEDGGTDSARRHCRSELPRPAPGE